jgi:hypothetical protein
MDFFDFGLMQNFTDIEQLKEYFRTNTIVLIIFVLGVYVGMWVTVALHYHVKEYRRRKRRLNAAKKMIGG